MRLAGAGRSGAARAMSAAGRRETWDAIVVGSGPNGGMAAKVLSESGLSVLVLEAGPRLDPRRAFGAPALHNAKRLLRLHLTHRQAVQSRFATYWESNPDLFVDDREHPYATPEGAPFAWIRGRQVGGRSLMWGGRALRLSDSEFKAASLDGHGEDWPIGLAELAPYYEAAERLLSVRGCRDGVAALPDGAYEGPLPLSPGERHLLELLRRSWPGRPAVVSRGTNSLLAHRWSAAEPWPAHSSVATGLGAALATGRTTLQPDSVVSHVVMDPRRKRARGVAVVDRRSLATREVDASLLVLCASTVETVRILLHSGEAARQGGLVDESGTLGCHLMDHIAFGSPIHFPSERPAGRDFPMVGGGGLIVPRFRNLAGDRPRDFLRGYGIWCSVGRNASLPKPLRRVHGGCDGLVVACGESLSRRENSVRLHRQRRDRYGIPIAEIDFRWGDNERAMATDMRQEVEAMVHAAGGQLCSMTELYRLPGVAGHIRAMEAAMMPSTPGLFVHETGGARMGSSRRNSVVDSANRVWNAPNLLVTDGACWPSAGWQNTTLTQMAVTARACTLAVEASKRGEL